MIISRELVIILLFVSLKTYTILCVLSVYLIRESVSTSQIIGFLCEVFTKFFIYDY
jgi:hypothetical protein